VPDVLALVIDTSSAAVTAGIVEFAPGTGPAGRGEPRVVAERVTVDARAHAELLTPFIAAGLDEAGIIPGALGSVIAGVGPGPFTGLRVGLVTAGVLGYALEVEVVGVCSLDAVAFGAVQAGVEESFIAAMDARRREVYWARYGVTKVGGVPVPVRLELPEVSVPADVPLEGLRVAGRGAELYTDVLGQPLEGPLDPPAGALAILAHLDSRFVLPAEPLYLRRPDAQANISRKRVLK
jgi:tRNA threonylcarbamoyl adenosine modification protein YeaZ